MTTAAYTLREDEAQFVAEKLTGAIRESKCECGRPECSTYRFRVAEKNPVSYYTVRFNVRGEMLLHIDSDGNIHSLERLYDDGGPRTVFARAQGGSWTRTEIP